MINAPERIWRLDLADGNDDDRIVYFDTPGPLSTGLDDSVEYVRKGVMDKIIQETLWQCHGVRM